MKRFVIDSARENSPCNCSLVMKKAFIILVCCIVCSEILLAQPADSRGTKHITILHTNDHHGHLFSFNQWFMRDVGGLPARAALINQIRSQNENVLLLDAGDINSGSIESDYFNAEADIVAYNYLNYDAVAMGNHEFDNELSVFLHQSKTALFPFLSANVHFKGSKDAIRPYVVKNVGGISVAIIGLTLKDAEIIGNPAVMKKVRVKDEVRSAKKYVRKLRDTVDLIIVLSHLGIYDDTERGSINLAKQVDGIDLIIDGHSHTKLDTALVVKNKNSEHTTLVSSAWCNGLAVGRLDIWINKENISKHSFALLPVNLQKKVAFDNGVRIEYMAEKIEPDQKLLEILRPYKDSTGKLFKKTIVRVDSAMNFNTENKKYNLKSIISNSMLWNSRDYKTDFSLVNQGCIRNTLDQGAVTLEKIYSVLPFNNTLYVVHLSGVELRKMLEIAFNQSEKKGASPLFSDNVQFEIVNGDLTNFTIDGREINEHKTYKIVTTSYIANGGDNYLIPHKKENVDLSIYQRDVLSMYLQNNY